MTPKLHPLRPLMLAALALALASTVTSCGWVRHRTSYLHSTENRPLEVPPGLDMPDTSAAVALPSAGAGQSTSPSDVRLEEGSITAYPRIGTILEGIEGVVIIGRAQALGSFDVSYKGQSFLIRVQDSNGGSRLLALSPDGRILLAGPAAELLAIVKTKL